MLIGWFIACLLTAYEHRLRKEADKNRGELVNRWIQYTLLVVVAMFLFVLEKNLDAVSGIVTGTGIILFFGVIFLGDIKQSRKNWRAKYKPLADLTLFDKFIEVLENKIIPDSCKIEPLEEDEDDIDNAEMK